MTTIEVTGLEKTFVTNLGKTVRALEDVGFTVAPGEFISLLGPSGCGKSTTLKILAGLEGRSTGMVCINGEMIVGPRPDVGVMFQTPTLLPWRTALDNVLLPIEVSRPREVGQYRERALELLELVGLSGFEKALPQELSGGMQQRVALARTLIYDPDVLLLDEPFGALDELTRDQMDLELMRIWQASKKTVIMVTHSITEAVLLSDRVLVMSARPGRIMLDMSIPLERPRANGVMTNPEYQKSVVKVRKQLGLDI